MEPEEMDKERILSLKKTLRVLLQHLGGCASIRKLEKINCNEVEATIILQVQSCNMLMELLENCNDIFRVNQEVMVEDSINDENLRKEISESPIFCKEPEANFSEGKILKQADYFSSIPELSMSSVNEFDFRNIVSSTSNPSEFEKLSISGYDWASNDATESLSSLSLNDGGIITIVASEPLDTQNASRNEMLDSIHNSMGLFDKIKLNIPEERKFTPTNPFLYEMQEDYEVASEVLEEFATSSRNNPFRNVQMPPLVPRSSSSEIESATYDSSNLDWDEMPLNMNIFTKITEAVDDIQISEEEFKITEDLRRNESYYNTEDLEIKIPECIDDNAIFIKERIKPISEVSSCPEDCSDIDLPTEELDEFKITETNFTDEFYESDVRYLNPVHFTAQLPVDDLFFLWDFEEVCTDPERCLPQQSHTKSFRSRHIYISEIFSPLHFWFQYDSTEIFNLMENIERDYCALDEKNLQISAGKIIPGFIVAGFVQNQWHRAITVTKVKKNQVRLFFMDYGTTGWVNLKHVKYLFNKYMNRPAFAYRGRIAGVQPYNREFMFDEKQTETFIRKIVNQKMVADVVQFNEDENVYEMNLKLIKNGIAEDICEWILSHHLGEPIAYTKIINGHVLKSIGPICIHMLTFKKLESMYPTYHEMTFMQRKEIDFHLLVNTNFFQSVEDDFILKTPAMLRMLGNQRFKKVKDYLFPSN